MYVTAAVAFGLVSVVIWSRDNFRYAGLTESINNTLFQLDRSICTSCGTLTLLTEPQLAVVDPGDSALLECSFTSVRYNMFDYPVIWRKQQLSESTQLNVMGSINRPFVSAVGGGANRFEVSFTATPPVYVVELSILDLSKEDSGNYTCEVRGPQSVSLGQVTHQLFIRDPVSKVLIIGDGNATDDVISVDTLWRQFSPSSLRTVENHPTRLRCIALGGYPPPSVELQVGRRDVTAEFSFRNSATLATSHGVRGLRRIDVRSERWTNNFLSRAEDDGMLIRCIASVPGLKPSVELVRLDVEFQPKIVCTSAGAYIGDRDVILSCVVHAKPRMTSLFWIVDSNGTTLSVGDAIDGFRSLMRDDVDGAVVAQLCVRRTRPESFRLYTIVAENSVAIAAKDVQLYHKQKAPTLPLADLTVAAASHVSQRETSREPRGRKSSNSGAAARRPTDSPSSTWLPLVASVVCSSSLVAAIVSRHPTLRYRR